MNHTKSKLSKLIVPSIVIVLTIGYCIVIFPKIGKTESGIDRRQIDKVIKANKVLEGDVSHILKMLESAKVVHRIPDVDSYKKLTEYSDEENQYEVYLILLRKKFTAGVDPYIKYETLIVLWDAKQKKVISTVLEENDAELTSPAGQEWKVSYLKNTENQGLVPQHSFILYAQKYGKVNNGYSKYTDYLIYGVVNDSLRRLVYLPKQIDQVEDEEGTENRKVIKLNRDWSFVESPDTQYASINIHTNISVSGSSRLGVQNYLTSDKTYSTIESSSSRYKTYGYGLRAESTVVNRWNGYNIDVDSHLIYQNNKYQQTTNNVGEEEMNRALTYVEANPIDGILKRLSLTREQVDLSLGVFIQQLKTGVSLLVLPVKRTIVKGNIRYKYYDIHYAYIDQKLGTVLRHLIDKDAFPIKDRSRFSLAKFGLVYNSDMPRDSDQIHFKVRYTFYANDEVGPFDMIVYEDVVTLNEKNIIQKDVAYLVVATDVFTKVENDNFTAIKKRLENQKKEANTKETIYTYKIEESEVDDEGYILSTIKKSQVEEKGTN